MVVEVEPVERTEQRHTGQEPHRGRHLAQLLDPRGDVNAPLRDVGGTETVPDGQTGQT